MSVGVRSLLCENADILLIFCLTLRETTPALWRNRVKGWICMYICQMFAGFHCEMDRMTSRTEPPTSSSKAPTDVNGVVCAKRVYGLPYTSHRINWSYIVAKRRHRGSSRLHWKGVNCSPQPNNTHHIVHATGIANEYLWLSYLLFTIKGILSVREKPGVWHGTLRRQIQLFKDWEYAPQIGRLFEFSGTSALISFQHTLPDATES